ncbi:MAG TPA: aminopeptidase P family N-terminal domain-containing protein [Gemmatimonadales bacterium]|nr:aminopeptidase P family N-terminal domain-containing protein [Gemmatimonadales bacterium]
MPIDRRPARRTALTESISAQGLDALLITARANVRYLTGFSGSAGMVVVTPSELLLVTDFRYDEQARAEAGRVARVEVERTSVWDRLFREMGRLGPLDTVGFEGHALTVREAERLVAGGKPWRWQPAGELVEALRVRKDEGEIAAIRDAATLAAEALRTTLARVRPGLS